MIECPHRCMHDQFCKKFLNHHCCTHVMEIMWDTFLYPWTTGQTNTSTYIMFSRSISLEPKSQLTINLHPGWEFPSSPSEENKKEKEVPDQRLEEDKRKRKFPIKDRKKAKEENSQSKIGRKQKRKKNSRSKFRRKQKKIYKKVFRPDNIWTIQNCHKQIRK